MKPPGPVEPVDPVVGFEPTGHGSDLPLNMLPAALPLLWDEGEGEAARDGASLVVSYEARREDREEPHLRWVRVVPVDAGTIRDPDALAERMARLRDFWSGVEREEKGAEPPRGLRRGDRVEATAIEIGPPAGEGAVFAPPSEAGDDGLPEEREPRKDRCGERGPPPVIGVIDAGIAVWNDRLWDGGSAFVDLGGLLFGPGGVGTVWLGPGRFRAITDGAFRDRPDADAAARRQLAGWLPGSVHAPRAAHRPRPAPDAFAHGTAMAALARRGAPADARLLGFELPMTVLEDSGGSFLSTVLDLAVRQVVDRAMQLDSGRRGTLPVTIVAAFAFLGGPVDGSEWVLAALERTIRHYAVRYGVAVTLVVPVGNHLLDRVHARAEGDGFAAPMLPWQILPFDHSFNTMEVLHDAPGRGRPLELRLRVPAAPDEAVAVIEEDRGRPARPFQVLRRLSDGGPVGAAWTKPVPDGRWRTRVTLVPTARRGGGVPLARPGEWKLRVVGGHGRVEGWIRRDDAPFADGRYAPRRQSWFADPRHRDDVAPDVLAVAPPEAPAGPARWAGTASLLATGRGPGIVAATARWSSAGGVAAPAPYAGHFHDDHPRVAEAVAVDAPGPRSGVGAVGDGTPRLFRVSGTSAAAALHAGAVARRTP